VKEELKEGGKEGRKGTAKKDKMDEMEKQT